MYHNACVSDSSCKPAIFHVAFQHLFQAIEAFISFMYNTLSSYSTYHTTCICIYTSTY